MHYEIEAGGRIRQVSVSRTGTGFSVSIDGRVHQVDAARVDAHALSLIVDGSAARSVVVAPQGPGGGLVVYVGTVPVPVTVNGRGRRAASAEAGASVSGPQRVVAPMPGRIVRVLVNAGDVVHPRQPLVVVEAMKMENELRAGRDGTVLEVHAREGQSVESGALLVVVQ